MRMNVLSPEVKLPPRLDRLTDPDLDLCRVERIVPMAGGALLVGLSGKEDGALRLLKPGGKRLWRIGGFDGVEEVWPAGPEGAIVQSGGALWRLELDGRKGRLVDLPEGLVSLDVAWGADGLIVGALVDRREVPDPDAPRFYPRPRETVTLCRYAPTAGWVNLAEAPWGCSGLSMSRDGRRMVWTEPVNVVPEEAQRGEFWGFDLGEGKVRRLTEGAGRVGKALVAPDGLGVIYQANHQIKRPITTHTDLWWMGWDGKGRRNLTGGGRCIKDFGWGMVEDRVWMTVVEGLEVVTGVVMLDGSAGTAFEDRPATSPVAWLADGTAVFETEGPEAFPAIRTGDRCVPLPQTEKYEDLQIASVQWTAPDGLVVEGVVYEVEGTPEDAPLLVSAHGGPASTVEALRSHAVRHRHLLRAGYRVFNPAFRGSLGFGDAFVQGNIGCQGEADLEDILSGVNHLVEAGQASIGRVGIFGGSYGGYMTLRALAVTDRFVAGVALFGFVSNRWMTLETGDFTYETEYIAPLSWPLTKKAQRSDVFPHLGSIQAPLLMLHGDRDPICTLSQSVVAYRALEDRRVPVGLVVYPGEGHGFRKKENRRDCARRVLAWFLEHLPLE